MSDSSNDLTAAKRLLREQARAARCALDPASCSAFAEAVAERLLALPELAGAHVVLAYSATPEEIDPAHAVDALRALGKTLALPRVEAKGVLGLHLVAHGDELEAGPFAGIAQPLADSPRLQPDVVDAVIVPGVAFDPSGRRLGYGGGFYDRLLPRLRGDCTRIGLAYDEQLVSELPVAEHDEHVDVIVTPTRVLRIRRQGSVRP